MFGKISPKRRLRYHDFVWLIALIGLFLLGGSGVSYGVSPEWGAMYAPLSAGIGLILVLAAVFLRPGKVRRFLAGRPVKYGSHAIVKSVAFLGILGLVNFLAVKYGGEIDLTTNGQFTLSAETIQILQQLDRPVEIIGFFHRSDPRMGTAKNYLERYCRYTTLLSYQFRDPDLNRSLVKKYGPAGYGLVFVSGSNRHETTTVNEHSLSYGLVRVSGNEKLKKDLSDMPVKQAPNRHVWLTPMQINVTIFTTLILIPLAVLVAGTGIWWRRR